MGVFTALSFSILASLLHDLPYINGLPLTYSVPRWSKECLYDKLEANEYLTMSLFIAHGSPLMANAIIEGPVAPPTGDDTAKYINEKIGAYNTGKRYPIDMTGKKRPLNIDQHGNLFFETKVDFEEYEYADDDYDDDESIWDDDASSVSRQRELIKQQKEKEKEQRDLRKEGEPFLKTFQVISPGWYRVCTNAVHNQVTIEMDMRKSSEHGEPDKSGHVPSEDREILTVVEQELEVDAAKEEDLAKAKEHIRDVHRLIVEIKSRQQKERHRLENHQEINLHSHSRMVLGSLMETALFIGVTGFQVFTIRKWFQGGPLLGL